MDLAQHLHHALVATRGELEPPQGGLLLGRVQVDLHIAQGLLRLDAQLCEDGVVRAVVDVLVHERGVRGHVQAHHRVEAIPELPHCLRHGTAQQRRRSRRQQPDLYHHHHQRRHCVLLHRVEGSLGGVAVVDVVQRLHGGESAHQAEVGEGHRVPLHVAEHRHPEHHEHAHRVRVAVDPVEQQSWNDGPRDDPQHSLHGGREGATLEAGAAAHHEGHGDTRGGVEVEGEAADESRDDERHGHLDRHDHSVVWEADVEGGRQHAVAAVVGHAVGAALAQQVLIQLRQRAQILHQLREGEEEDVDVGHLRRDVLKRVLGLQPPPQVRLHQRAASTPLFCLAAAGRRLLLVLVFRRGGGEAFAEAQLSLAARRGILAAGDGGGVPSRLQVEGDGAHAHLRAVLPPPHSGVVVAALACAVDGGGAACLALVSRLGFVRGRVVCACGRPCTRALHPCGAWRQRRVALVGVEELVARRVHGLPQLEGEQFQLLVHHALAGEHAVQLLVARVEAEDALRRDAQLRVFVAVVKAVVYAVVVAGFARPLRTALQLPPSVGLHPPGRRRGEVVMRGGERLLAVAPVVWFPLVALLLTRLAVEPVVLRGHVQAA
mmetsp:Transcript_1112/g.3900  ORF Transcript_1112/g.3900 Transcript_1112/m.3900 type:complete len:603 (-) Transcript_1112:1643-3451(-)